MKKKGMTDKALREFFEILNVRFFQNSIPMCLNIRFASDRELKNSDGNHRDGPGMLTVGEILIHNDLRYHPDLACLVLIHEMCHAELHESGYIGYEHDGGHGSLWHARMVELFKAGIFEGLL